jgi:pilus assembly protein CpaE
MTEASVVAVGTPQSFRQQIARALEVEMEEIGWAQSATVAEELLINAFTPIDVLVLSPEVKEPDALGLAEFVGRQSPGTAIVLVRDHTWNGLLPAAMRAGIRDVVDMTQGTEELRDAVERAVAWATNLRSMGGTATESSNNQRGRIISVFSSKGGSGKTFLTTNLAAAIADITGQDVAVVDLDTDMGDVFTYFGREPSARVDDMMGLGEGADHERIREIGVPFGEHLWGYGSPLDVVGVKHLSKALDTLLTIGLPRERFRVVLNRADSKVGLDASDVERVMKITVDAMIPSSRLVPTALNKGRPVVLDEPNSDVSTAVRQLATRFAHQFEVSVAETGGNANGNGSKPEKTKRKRFSRTAS